MESIRGSYMATSLEIDGWKANIRFSSSHILLGHRNCGFLHGHTYAIHLWVYGEKDNRGFIIDFTIVKSALREIATTLDHRILIPEKNRFVFVTEKEIRIKTPTKLYRFPKEDCVLLPLKSVTAEHLSDYILSEFLKKITFSKNISKIDIGIDEGFGQVARAKKIIG
jgi:6-pyruvoyltetrahydropterin/6-carboxytetrahydropterin synthase